jgi:hypothetical protein
MFALPRTRAPLHPLGLGLAVFTAALAIVVIPPGRKAPAVGGDGAQVLTDRPSFTTGVRVSP